MESPFHLARKIPGDTWKTVTDAWNGYHSAPSEKVIDSSPLSSLLLDDFDTRERRKGLFHPATVTTGALMLFLQTSCGRRDAWTIRCITTQTPITRQFFWHAKCFEDVPEVRN